MDLPATPCSQRPPTELGRKLSRVRPWVQALFLGVWLAPIGRWVGGLPSCVFHCYSCPLASFACPVGVAANYAALFPAVFEIPVSPDRRAAARAGSPSVRWSAAGRVPSVCPGLSGPTHRPEDHPARLDRTHSLRRARRSRARAADDPRRSRYSLRRTIGFHLSPLPGRRARGRTSLLGPGTAFRRRLADEWVENGDPGRFIGAAIVVDRPWCRIFCPLGGWLALFNRWSLFHLRFTASACSECNLCRTRCRFGVKVDEQVNVPGCVRCLECTACGAIQPALALPLRAPVTRPTAVR